MSETTLRPNLKYNTLYGGEVTITLDVDRSIFYGKLTLEQGESTLVLAPERELSAGSWHAAKWQTMALWGTEA